MLSSIASSSAESRKATSAQIEAERLNVAALIEEGSERVSFAVCVAGRAPVWNIFRKVLLDRQATPFVVCQVCGKLLKYTSRDGTKSMKAHMNKCTPVPEGTIGEAESSLQIAEANDTKSEASPKPDISSLDTSLPCLPQSPSVPLTSLTPAPSRLSGPELSVQGGVTLSQEALQTVSIALHSTVQIIDNGIQEVDVEIDQLQNKMIMLSARRVELLRRKEVIRLAILQLTGISELVPGFDGKDASSLHDADEMESEVEEVAAKRSRRKQSASSVRHLNQPHPVARPANFQSPLCPLEPREENDSIQT